MRQKFNLALAVLALLCVFFVFDAVAHQGFAVGWPKMIGGLVMSGLCIAATREREWLDTFLAALAGLLILFAVATTTALRQHPRMWSFLGAFVIGAAVLVLLTRRKREALLGIAAIVGLRLIWAGFLLLRG